MATTDKVVNFARKMLVSRERWADNFLTYLRQEIESVTKSVFFQGGVIEDATIGITSSVNDTFTLDITNASRVADGLGHVMDLANLPSGDITDYPFVNTNLETYFVGIRFQSPADTVERNPRTAQPQYVLTEDTIGELGDPDSVADNTTFIRLVIDGLLEASVDHSGRPVKVYLKTPVSPTASVAFHTGTVAFTGGINVVDIPYTVAQGPLGQTAPSFPISLVAADYTVHVQGPSWFEGVDIRSDPLNYAFIGIVTGNGPAATPTSFDISDQNTVFLLSLDKAYRAGVTTTPAPGRSILVDKWAVQLNQSATSQRQQDPANTPLLISKIGETIEGGSAKIVETPWDTRTFGTWDLQVLADAATGGDLQPTEAVNVATATVTFTRGAIALTAAAIDQYLRESTSYIRITGSSLGNDGLYEIGTVASISTLTVSHMDGSSPSFAAESGLTATVFVLGHRRATVEDPVAGTYDATRITWEHQFPITGRGLLMRMSGDQLALTEGNVNPYIQADWYNASGDNTWLRLLPGQLQIRGGGDFNRANKIFGEGTDRITGWAHFQSDKIDIFGLTSSSRPDEGDSEWGFDYRGYDFKKDDSSDEPGFQLASAFRHPWTDHDGGAKNIRAVETFTQTGGVTIDLTRVGADTTNLPADATNLANFVLAELEYSTANANDGVYWVSGKTGTIVSLKKLGGGNPILTAGSGTVRFYGGSFFGPLPIGRGAAGIRPGWVQSLVQPTTEGGGLLHMIHRYPSRTAVNLHAVSATGPDTADITWALKGSMMFARSISTNIGLLPSADDSIRTALLEATSINLTTAVWELKLADTLSNTDVIKRQSGGTWTVTRVISRFRGQAWSSQSSAPWSVGDVTWGPDDALTTSSARRHISQTPGNVEAFYWVPMNLPQGATLTNIDVRVTPVIGLGSGISFGLRMHRSQWDLETVDILRATPDVRAAGGSNVLQTVAYSCDQNNVIDNTLFEYYLSMQKSDTAGSSSDQVLGVRITFTVAALGQSLFDAI